MNGLPPQRPEEAPCLGVGVGLRPPHYGEIFAAAEAGRLAVDFFEILSENYMIPGGRPLAMLDRICELTPVVAHGVSLSIGSTDPLRADYLDALERLARRARPRWISDHLCWTGVGGHNSHDLLPLPMSEATIDHLVPRIRAVQERLGRRIALENVSSYLQFQQESHAEWELLLELCERADCGLLLDVNNVFVSAHNHGFCAESYLDAIPGERVFQIHLAGHSQSGPLLIDTHDHPVRDEVWTLYERVIRRIGPVSTLIEWDAELPPFGELVAEAERARKILERTSAGAVA